MPNGPYSDQSEQTGSQDQEFQVMRCRVAGVTFEGRQEYIRQMTVHTPIRIVPEPENPYDKNALAVHAALSEGVVKHVGYIPAKIAARIAAKLEGESLMAKVHEVTGGFDKGEDFGTASYGLLIEVQLPPAATYEYR